MWNIKAICSYDDYSPAITLLNGEKIKPIKDGNGKDYFRVSTGDVLTVPEDRGQYLINDRRLAELISIDKVNAKPIETTDKVISNVETADVKTIVKPKRVAKPKAKATTKKK